MRAKVETLKRDRPKYVVACLTILRAYIVAGAPARFLRNVRDDELLDDYPVAGGQTIEQRATNNAGPA